MRDTLAIVPFAEGVQIGRRVAQPRVPDRVGGHGRQRARLLAVLYACKKVQQRIAGADIKKASVGMPGNSPGAVLAQ
ncbi:hypothetical protein GCM10007388_12040 [Pseudoduganella plicata]|uniref:Uncharacterized protein n=1 Tax=Pseudoduganella plicata TaxID=321984 RepID=A0AA88C7J6_9BURK|nr:hypothetical protein GCM10007388_12040 [Pseudoduganella plicata]